MDQREINAALQTYITTGDAGPWSKVITAIKDEDVQVQYTNHRLTISFVANPLRVELGRRIKAAQKECGLTQVEIAARAGVTVTPILRLIAGTNVPRWPTFAAILQAMGEDPESYRAAYREIKG